jgi:hypothetical protein
MRSVFTFLFCICIFPSGYAQEPSSAQVAQFVDPVKFDEWGDIPFSDEKARLDNVAINLKKLMPRNIIYLVIYAGQRACVGESKARGVRAKRHLVSRGIPPAQVVWIDGGHQREATTEVWMWPPGMDKPSPNPELNLKPSEVKFEKNCRIKYRAGRTR